MIELQAGTTFTGPFTLPNKTGTGWIYIVSSALGSLPAAGTRVSPSDASNMPKIVAPSSSNALVTANGAHHIRIVGCEICPASGVTVTNVIDHDHGLTSAANSAEYIVYDRCYIHGDPTTGCVRALWADGEYIAIVECYISDCKKAGQEAQAIWLYQGAGPYKIVNNYLEGAGENFMSGGADPRITNAVPSDIEFSRNHVYKPPAWNGVWTVKNSFELKNAKRVLVHGNVFENCWPDAQNGYGIVLTVRNQDGGANWSTIEDLTFRRNRCINFGRGINILGRDSPNTSQVMARVLIEDNEMDVNGYGGGSGWGMTFFGGPTHVTIRHNTIFSTTASAFAESTPDADNIVIEDNIQSGSFYGTGTSEGNSTLDYYFTNLTHTSNVLIGRNCTLYPAGNYCPANVAAVEFEDYAGGDYRLAVTSDYANAASDGEDMGADIAAIDAAIAGTDQSLAGPANVRWRPA